MQSFYLGKYPILSLELKTKLTEKPAWPDEAELDSNYNWNYDKWEFVDGRLTYNGQTTKDPDNKEIESIMNLIFKADPTVYGYMTLGEDPDRNEDCSYPVSVNEYVIHKGEIKAITKNLVLALLDNQK